MGLKLSATKPSIVGFHIENEQFRTDAKIFGVNEVMTLILCHQVTSQVTITTEDKVK